VGLGDLLQRVASVDDRLELSRLHHIREQREIGRVMPSTSRIII
jgi:hypothetical protein